MPSLILMFKDRILNLHPLTEGNGLTIGRHPGNDIVIDNLAVSGYHARIEYRAEGYALVDLESKNGTYLNDQPISACMLSDQDTITIGKHALLVDLTDQVRVEESVTDTQVSRPTAGLNADRTMVLDNPAEPQGPGKAAPSGQEQAPNDFLVILAGGQGVIELTDKMTISIGCNLDADIPVGGLWAMLIGSPAATIQKRAGVFVLRYAGGLIKPKCNGSSIKGSVKLNHDDIVTLGPVKLQVQLNQQAAGQFS